MNLDMDRISKQKYDNLIDIPNKAVITYIFCNSTIKILITHYNYRFLTSV